MYSPLDLVLICLMNTPLYQCERVQTNIGNTAIVSFCPKFGDENDYVNKVMHAHTTTDSAGRVLYVIACPKGS